MNARRPFTSTGHTHSDCLSKKRSAGEVAAARALKGLLVYPLDYQPGQSYPLVTITHGGPRTSSRFGSWNITRYLPVLAAQGYMVLLPNHRGGTGYGDRFMRDMYGAYFRNAHHDVMDGVEALVDQGMADPDRLIKMGWSAGGHMVNKLITHTDVFAAASSGAGASDWRSMHGESDVRYGRQFVFGGAPGMRRAPTVNMTETRRYKTLESHHADFVLCWRERCPRATDAVHLDVSRVQATGTPTILYQAEDEPHNFRKPSQSAVQDQYRAGLVCALCPRRTI